jgi:hypothetical protein
VRNAAARREDWADTSASASTRQPDRLSISAPDSMSPRSTAAAMKGLPSARRTTTSSASGGTAPAIESTSCLMSPASNGASASEAAPVSRRSA